MNYAKLYKQWQAIVIYDSLCGDDPEKTKSRLLNLCENYGLKNIKFSIEFHGSDSAAYHLYSDEAINLFSEFSKVDMRELEFVSLDDGISREKSELHDKIIPTKEIQMEFFDYDKSESELCDNILDLYEENKKLKKELSDVKKELRRYK